MTRPFLRYLLFAGFLLLALFALAACKPAAPVATETVAQPTAVCPEPAVCPDLKADVPFFEGWQNSAHAQADSPPFTHWNEENPAEIPTTCAKCHSSYGFLDYVGADGSAAGVVDAAAKTGSVITCNTCHNAATQELSTVVFPSGAEIGGLGGEAVCMTCHQGTASMVQVDEAIAKSGAADDDTIVDDLGFTNLHYYAAAVSRYGTLVKGGYEYKGKLYDALWEHAKGVDTCVDCHNSHSLEIKVETCAACHEGIKSVEDVRDIRMISSAYDYDGDEDVEEGIAGEIEGLRGLLLEAMQAYAQEVAGSPLAYSTDIYPYFFTDTNANGQLDADEGIFPNSFKSWTPRLGKAAYNYQASVKDPGAYVHGGKYIIQLLYDSIESLNEKLATPVDLSTAHRDDPGHFAGDTEPFRHWDEEGMVPGTCAKCHTSGGLPQFLANNTNISMPVSDGLSCETCHSNLQTFARHESPVVTFPSGAKLSFEDSPDDNLCLNCHQGQQSAVSVGRLIAGLDPDQSDEKLRFLNIHYFAAGATLFGTEAKGMYEYPNKKYAGAFSHPAPQNTCSGCHDAHALAPDEAACIACHRVEEPEQIRMKSTGDYDGDGNAEEGLKGEVDTMAEQLYAAMQTYARDALKAPIAYDPYAYPYFFADSNDNGKVDAEEMKPDNSYKNWTPRLVAAAYNYQYVQKDPGAYVHNAPYILQVLYDTLDDLGKKVPINMQGKVRP
ncbi:MAG: hypothetical protein IT308_11645 [Anaerolineaceae bacterium]|nr:hypothetical protein [Anaerolineaceae bacterium]